MNGDFLDDETKEEKQKEENEKKKEVYKVKEQINVICNYTKFE